MTVKSFGQVSRAFLRKRDPKHCTVAHIKSNPNPLGVAVCRCRVSPLGDLVAVRYRSHFAVSVSINPS